MAVSDWSTTADNNTSVGGINIAEHCPAKNINNAIREVMAQVKAERNDALHLTGTETVTGNKTFTGTVNVVTPASSDDSTKPATTEWIADNVSQVPVGTIIWSANASVPAGYLLCNGSAVGRATYPKLYAAIGTTYGIGDGSTTFNLPNLINKFIEGGNTAGTEYQAGLPGINGTTRIGIMTNASGSNTALTIAYADGAFASAAQGKRSYFSSSGTTTDNYDYSLLFDASRSSPVYGNSTTVQPAAVTALPCIKAFSSVVGDATVVAGQLVNEIQSKVALDGSNTSSIGSVLSTYMAHAAMPSGQYEDLTLPANGGTVEAPADGWMSIAANTNSGGGYVALAGVISFRGFVSGAWAIACIPVSKGTIVTVTWNNTSTPSSFRFYYANGSALTV